MASPTRRLPGLAAIFAVAVALLAISPAGASASRTGVSPAIALEPQLLLIHGGSFLYRDPEFELATREAALAAGFQPHYLEYPLGDVPAAIERARLAAKQLRRRYRAPVYAYGSSAGGTLAAIIAGEGLVEGAAAKAPPTDLTDWEWPLSTYGEDYLARIGIGNAEAARRLSPLRRPARRPILIVHGRQDQVVPASMSAAYAAKFPRVRTWLVPGGHWTERTRPWVMEGTFDWLKRTARVQLGI